MHSTSTIQQFGLVYAALAHPALQADQAWTLLAESGLSDVLCANPQDVQDLQACIVSAMQAMSTTTLATADSDGITATLAQASLAWYTTQHWYTYVKWTERKFLDAIVGANMESENSNGEDHAVDADEWFGTELKWLDDTVLPTLQRLDEQVMLSQLRNNRESWSRDGLAKVHAWSLKYGTLASASSSAEALGGSQNLSGAKAA